MSTLTKKTERQAIRLDGVVIGVLVGLNENQVPMVVFPENPHKNAVPARGTVELTQDDIGKEIALLFEQGDPDRPLVIGLIHKPDKLLNSPTPEQTPLEVDLDDNHLVLNAKQSITLKCGKASVTLTKAGKVLVRGTYLLNRSSGVNRIKGGSVQIN